MKAISSPMVILLFITPIEHKIKAIAVNIAPTSSLETVNERVSVITAFPKIFRFLLLILLISSILYFCEH